MFGEEGRQGSSSNFPKPGFAAPEQWADWTAAWLAGSPEEKVLRAEAFRTIQDKELELNAACDTMDLDRQRLITPFQQAVASASYATSAVLRSEHERQATCKFFLGTAIEKAAHSAHALTELNAPGSFDGFEVADGFHRLIELAIASRPAEKLEIAKECDKKCEHLADFGGGAVFWCGRFRVWLTVKKNIQLPHTPLRYANCLTNPAPTGAGKEEP